MNLTGMIGKHGLVYLPAYKGAQIFHYTYIVCLVLYILITINTAIYIFIRRVTRPHVSTIRWSSSGY